MLMYIPPKPKMYEHRSTYKKNLDDFLKRSWFDELVSTWTIFDDPNTQVRDRITVLQNHPESEYESIDVTPSHKTNAMHFKLNVVNHSNFDFFIYNDYDNPNLVYFKPAVYYYGNYIKDYIFGLVTGANFDAPFLEYCTQLEKSGDHFAMHNYKIDMEMVEKHKLMR